MIKKNRNLIARIAIIVAGVAAFATIVLALILKAFSLPVQIGLGVFVLGLAIFLLLKPQEVKAFLTGRQAKHGSNALILTIAVLAILVVVNLIGYNNTVRWDLTEDRTNTLADETLDVLKTLEEDVTATGFFTTANYSLETARTLLENYKGNASGKFDYEIIDPNQDPVAANEAGITRDGSIVLKQGDVTEIITSASESEITSALIRLRSPEEKKLYVLTGHGEAEFAANADASYFYANDELQSKKYTVEELNLLATNTIPEDATALLITGPQKPLAESEVTQIEAYLQQGGALIVMYEPSILTQFDGQEDPLAGYLAESWGVTFEDNLVIDLTANPASMAVAASYGDHPITSEMGNMVSLLPTARSITLSEARGITGTDLASTSNQSWAEFDWDSIQANSPGFDEEEDLGGPVVLAAALEDLNSGSRVVVFGDAEFATNNYYSLYGNPDFFLNAVDWTAGEESLINLTARTQTERLLVPPSGYVLNAILLVVIVLIPLVIIATAVVVLVKRHREV